MWGSPVASARQPMAGPLWTRERGVVDRVVLVLTRETFRSRGAESLIPEKPSYQKRRMECENARAPAPEKHCIFEMWIMTPADVARRCGVRTLQVRRVLRSLRSLVTSFRDPHETLETSHPPIPHAHGGRDHEALAHGNRAHAETVEGRAREASAGWQRELPLSAGPWHDAKAAAVGVLPVPVQTLPPMEALLQGDRPAELEVVGAQVGGDRLGDDLARRPRPVSVMGR